MIYIRKHEVVESPLSKWETSSFSGCMKLTKCDPVCDCTHMLQLNIFVRDIDKVKTKFIDNNTKWRFFFCEAEICKHIITCINTVLLFCSGEKDCFYKHICLIVCMFFTASVYTNFWIKHYMAQVTWSNCMCLGASIFNL